MKKTLSDLSPTELENLSFDLLQKLGMRNVVWRTPGRDGGRDIQGECFVEDISGFVQQQNWYIDCKRYSKSLSWPTVWEKISFSESNSADVLLIITSSSLSPQAVDEVNKWNRLNSRLKIRFWNAVDLESKLRLYPEVLVKYGLIDNPSREKAVALLPLTRVLLKFTNSAYSSQVFGQGGKESKLNVIFSLSELIAVRLYEMDKNNEIKTSNFRASDDGYEWLSGAGLIEDNSFDRYAFRALACYLIDVLRLTNLGFYKCDGGVCLKIGQKFLEYVERDIVEILLLSNIQAQFKNEYLMLRGVE